jgi:hypothetical protein
MKTTIDHSGFYLTKKQVQMQEKQQAAAPEMEKLELVLQAIRDAAGTAVLAAGEPGWCVHLDEAVNKLAIDMRLAVRQGE